MSEMMTEGEEEEVFALHFAEALLGSDAVAHGIPSPAMDDIADDHHFSVYWRSSAGSSVAKNDPNVFRHCLYVDITIQFQKTTLPDRNAVTVNVQFGSFWKEQQSTSPDLQPQNEKDIRYRYVVLRADPSSSAPDHCDPWFAQLRRKHWQSSLGIDVEATPGPVLAQLWGRAWREWTPEHAAWNHDGGPCVYLRYPPEFARSRVPFPFFDETATEKKTTDPSLSPARLECEVVPVLMAQSILLQHRQSSRVWHPTADAATATLSTPDASKATISCWDLYQQWKHRTSCRSLSAALAAAGITATELPQHTSEPTMVATAATKDAPERPPTSTEAAPKRRRIVRPNAPRRVPMASTRPPGHRFV